jgi:hypothetical protein
LAVRAIREAATSLVADALACAAHPRNEAHRSSLSSPGTLLKQPRFARLVAQRLRELVVHPDAPAGTGGRMGSSAVGALLCPSLAAVEAATRTEQTPAPHVGSHGCRSPHRSSVYRADRPSPTGRVIRVQTLDRMSLSGAIRLMLREDARLPRALWAERTGIERAIRLVVSSLRRGGRLFYVGLEQAAGSGCWTRANARRRSACLPDRFRA